MEKLIYDTPSSKGIENVLKRAYAYANMRWTPIDKMPCTYQAQVKKGDGVAYAYYKPYRPVTGLPYSSARIYEKFLHYNVSLETFYSALSNPQSVMYTRNLTGKGSRMSSWYGVVCSTFASYAYDFKIRRIARDFPNYNDDMRLIDPCTPQDAKLAYCLVNQKHVALITGVAKDEKGNVRYVTVTECTPNKMVSTEFSSDEFQKYWLDNYKMYEYLDVDKVEYQPSPYIHLDGDPELEMPKINGVLQPDYGDKANYFYGETVEFNVMQDGWEKLTVETESGEKQYEMMLDRTQGVRTYKPEKLGCYRAYCTKGGEKSDYVYFAVVEIKTEVEVSEGKVTFSFITRGDDPAVSCYVTSSDDKGFLRFFSPTEEESAQRKMTLEGLEKGAYTVRTLLQNKYGQYLSGQVAFDI